MWRGGGMREGGEGWGGGRERNSEKVAMEMIV